MRVFKTLTARLVLSHLAVSIVSISLMATFAGRYLFQAVIAEAEHNLQGLAVAAGNAIELPIEDLRAGRVTPNYIKDLLARLFADIENLQFTVFTVTGTPIADSSDTLPNVATNANAPEVLTALESELGRGISIRPDLQGQSYIYIAVLVQRDIEVTGILRVGIPMESTLAGARRTLWLLIGAAAIIASMVGVVGWVLARNLARPIRVLTQATGQMEQGDLSVRVRPTGPEELRRLTEAFNSMASRLQSNVNELRAFVANASHELRTPLTVVKLRTEALQQGAMEEPDVANRFVAEIETEIDRLVRMVNDLLDLSRMEAGLDSNQRITLSLSTIAREVYEAYKIRAARAGINLSLDIEPGLPEVHVNEDQVRRVFFNLVENAIKFTPPEGQVEMLLRPGPTGETVRFLVRDTGPGITPEHLPHVFERFYRADTNQSRQGTMRGSGLGLAIAKSIVESHAGEIGVSSQVGSGTTFWADLPAVA